MKYKNDIIAVVIVLGFLGLISFYYLNLAKVTDASKFKEEYSNVSEDNVFVYRTDKEIIDILKHGTGIVYLGFPECPWCQAYVSYLDEVAKETKIEKIYYLNILEIRKNNTREYQEIVSLLDNYLSYDEEGKKRIYVPAIVAVKEGEIIGFDDETSHDTKGHETPEEYWKNEDLAGLKKKLKDMFNKTNTNVCTTDCNK